MQEPSNRMDWVKWRNHTCFKELVWTVHDEQDWQVWWRRMQVPLHDWNTSNDVSDFENLRVSGKLLRLGLSTAMALMNPTLPEHWVDKLQREWPLDLQQKLNWVLACIVSDFEGDLRWKFSQTQKHHRSELKKGEIKPVLMSILEFKQVIQSYRPLSNQYSPLPLPLPLTPSDWDIFKDVGLSLTKTPGSVRWSEGEGWKRVESNHPSILTGSLKLLKYDSARFNGFFDMGMFIECIMKKPEDQTHEDWIEIMNVVGEKFNDPSVSREHTWALLRSLCWGVYSMEEQQIMFGKVLAHPEGPASVLKEGDPGEGLQCPEKMGSMWLSLRRHQWLSHALEKVGHEEEPSETGGERKTEVVRHKPRL